MTRTEQLANAILRALETQHSGIDHAEGVRSTSIRIFYDTALDQPLRVLVTHETETVFEPGVQFRVAQRA